ncbi:hypothetical protein Ae168Ps1_0545c [Pseudonocardia sp. Ae168_Ps1]|uniref:hypothetical protein n=1 Tax=unclassified Pseudonocardia TaxID=2619320 RepID=UPI000967B313|nr:MULTISPECIES: hypothetical protein [unclassified Pseudonocardia]OLL72171.1 hypothetical protein Ae150APs1_0549c [Pseudonocardia sp. Ae150A_Ps1]OLL78139.1 hypothetical protein Ae168Ps1_0545c [Pseudonocardia sp. Ae168_Ps1]OLL87738.1 hypothetical protein Ae263Ps1_4793 [Pseudonocardia sp. Ae263_Ps1]OLL92236.1 hypothetical protein Ae356Ps1_2133c [Pseudonocardia sp. Ae356_Ps1]
MTSETRRTGGPDPSARSRGEQGRAGRTTQVEESPSERTQFVAPPGPDSPTTAVRGPVPRPGGDGPVPPPPPGPGGQPPPPPGPTGPVGPLWTWAAPVLAVLAVVLLPLAAATTDLSDMGGWGLAPVLSPLAWVALLLAIACCVVELWSPRPRIPMLGAATGVLVLCSTGMPSVVEPQARFTTAWLISGFVDAVSANNGVPPTGVDARFYWPGFFAQWAWFRDAGGADQLDTILRWYPPAVTAVWAIGVYALARSMLGGTRAPWVAAWLFIGLNWIEQDYFSPQATAIVLQLTVLTFALGPLATRRVDNAGIGGWPRSHRGAPPLPRWRRWLVSAMTPPNSPTLPPRQLLLIFFCAALCVIAVAPTHQLTPFAIIGQLVVLALVGRFRGRGLVFIAILAVTVFILIAARDFWMTQISMIIGSSDEGGALAAGVTDRLQGDTGQIAVKFMRAGMTGLIYLIGFAGAWVYWKRRRDLVPILLAVIPMGMAAVQSYGGELFLRILLFGLPILTILAVDALRAFVRVDRAREKLLAVAMVAVFGLLILIRGGNEAYLDVTTEDVQMTRQAYDQAPPGATVQPLSTIGPYALEGVGEHNNMASGGEGCAILAADEFRCIDQVQPQTILFYGSIEKQGVVLNDRQPGWTIAIRDQLIASGQYRATYEKGFNAVLVRNEVAPAPGVPAPAPPAGDAPAPAAGEEVPAP